MKKIITTPILILSLGVTLFSLIGAEQAKAYKKVIGYCKVVKTSAGKFNVKRISDNRKYGSWDNKNDAINYATREDDCDTTTGNS